MLKAAISCVFLVSVAAMGCDGKCGMNTPASTTPSGVWAHTGYPTSGTMCASKAFPEQSPLADFDTKTSADTAMAALMTSKGYRAIPKTADEQKLELDAIAKDPSQAGRNSYLVYAKDGDNTRLRVTTFTADDGTGRGKIDEIDCTNPSAKSCAP